MKQKLAGVWIGLIFAFVATAHSAVTGQWDFTGSNLNATVGAALSYRGATAATTSFTTAIIGGLPAVVMKFPATTPTQGYTMTHGIAPNGGGTGVNQYTLIMDIMYPAASSGAYRGLLQTSVANADDGDLFVGLGDGIGISGVYSGNILPDTWHRVAFVFDLTLPAQRLRKFIDGALVGTQDLSDGVDGRWSLNATALLFADNDSETRAGFVNSIQIRSEAMLDADIAVLGGATAAGIPLPSAPSSILVAAPNGGENYQAGASQAIVWSVNNPSGLVQIDLYRGGVFFQSLAQVALSQSNYVWTINPALGDANNYRIQLTSVGYPAVTDSSDQDFSIFGSTGSLNPLFGQPLQTNGGFESLFTHWQIIAGNPLVLTGADGKGSPHDGTHFLHGGINSTASSSVIREDIDLIAAGFATNELDTGAALDAEAWLRNYHGADTFDDQVFCRVGYLDSADQELSAVRSIIAADSAWLQRKLSGLLPAGTRKLRLEIIGKHRRDTDNDSMADDVIVRLQKPFPLPTPNITKLPILQDFRQDAMTLLWETDGNLALPAVDWGRSNVSEHACTQIETVQIDTTHFVHRATLSGLSPETSYDYRVRSGTTTSPTFSFRTAPLRDTPFTVAWWGDSQVGPAVLQQFIPSMIAHGVDWMGVAGDLVSSGSSLYDWQTYWFGALEFQNIAQTRPALFARGNHDGEYALSYAYSALPGNESWFAFDYGNSRFIFLDTEAPTSVSPEQYAWLTNELARPGTQQAAFRIVCFHKPPYADLWDGGGYTGETFVRNDWVPLFTRMNVDLVINGHMHAYQRGATNGVMYVVSGGGGGALDTQIVADWPLVQAEYSRFHFDIMQVNGLTLSWDAYDNNSQLLDTFTLQSRVPLVGWQAPAPGGGGPALTVTGKAGTSYVLESSTDLANWTTFVTNAIPLSGPPRFTNSVALDTPLRLFRARAIP